MRPSAALKGRKSGALAVPVSKANDFQRLVKVHLLSVFVLSESRCVYNLEGMIVF